VGFFFVFCFGLFCFVLVFFIKKEREKRKIKREIGKKEIQQMRQAASPATYWHFPVFVI